MRARPALTRYPTAGARMECSTANASNVMPQIFVGVRSLITCRSSTRHLVKVSQVFCGACTGQGAPSRRPHAWSGCACVSTIALGCRRSNFRPNRGRNRSSHPRRDTRPSARYAYDAVALASQSHRACRGTLISSGETRLSQFTDVLLLDKILRASTSADLPGFQLLPRRRFIFAPRRA